MLKLIVSDLDGTLLPKGAETLDRDVLDMLAKLQEKGIFFAVASGRAYYELKRFFGDMESEICFIASDGALVVCGEDNLSEKPIASFLLRQAASQAHLKESTAVVFSGKYLSYYISKDSSFAEKLRKERHYHVLEVRNVSEIKEPIFKISLYRAAEKQTAKLSEKLSLVYCDGDWMDFVAQGADKGSALQKLCEKLDLRAEEVLVFGDNDNDVSMLRFTSNSCAMESGSAAARKAANIRTDSVTKTVNTLLNGR